MQAPAAVQTPSWGGASKASGARQEDGPGKDTAAPKTWKGVGEWQVCRLQSATLLPVIANL